MQRNLTRHARILTKLIAALASIALVTGVFVFLFVRGAFGLDDWVIRQVTAIAQTYVVPTMEFESFNYRAPRTVELDGVTFTAPDGTEVINAGRIELTLAEIPQRGRPIVIESVSLTDSVLRLVRDADADGVMFKGLVPFVKRSNIEQQATVSEEVRLSTVLQLRRVRLHNMGFEYVPGLELPPLMLDGFDLAMDVEPRDDVADGSARTWHTIAAVLDRGRLLQLDLNGRVDLDTFEFEFDGTRLSQQIDAETIKVLPPQWQTFLTDANAAGDLAITVNGRYPLSAPETADLTAHVELDEVNFDIGDFHIDTHEADIMLALRDGVATADPVSIKFYNGNFEGAALWPLVGDNARAQADWQITEVQLENLLRAGVRNEENPTLAGVLNLTGSASVVTDDPRKTLDGGGALDVRQGRLAIMPAVDAIIDATSNLATGSSLPTQTLDMQYQLEPDWIRFSEIDFSADVFAVSGAGTVGYDGTLDFAFRGGPVQRLTNQLGIVGRVLGGVTERAVVYRIRGTTAEPKVSTQPLGIGGELDR